MAKYNLDPIADNCYPYTSVLINKFNIQDEDKLLEVEIAITQLAAASWELSPLNTSFDFEHYKAIHHHLFHEIYEWAGQVRTVNISKRRTFFCSVDKLDDQAKRIFNRLKKANYLKGLNKDDFTSEFIQLYEITNYLHPFRDGNGRAQRLFLAQLARNAGFSLDFADMDVDDLMIATIQSSQGEYS